MIMLARRIGYTSSVLLAAVLGAAPVTAAVVTATYTGTVSNSTTSADATNNAFDGQAFTAVFTTDTSVNAFKTTNGTAISQIFGGSQFFNVSPTSAVLTIGSNVFTFSGSYHGQTTQDASYRFDEAQSLLPNGGFASIFGEVINRSNTLSVDLTTPYSFADVSGTTESFTLYHLTPDNQYADYLSGTLNIAGVTVADGAIGAVPEISTWAMMISGMGAVGYSMRRRKVMKRVAQAA